MNEHPTVRTPIDAMAARAQRENFSGYALISRRPASGFNLATGVGPRDRTIRKSQSAANPSAISPPMGINPPVL